jgi:hypothetical protein
MHNSALTKLVQLEKVFLEQPFSVSSYFLFQNIFQDELKQLNPSNYLDASKIINSQFGFLRMMDDLCLLIPITCQKIENIRKFIEIVNLITWTTFTSQFSNSKSLSDQHLNLTSPYVVPEMDFHILTFYKKQLMNHLLAYMMEQFSYDEVSAFYELNQENISSIQYTLMLLKRVIPLIKKEILSGVFHHLGNYFEHLGVESKLPLEKEIPYANFLPDTIVNLYDIRNTIKNRMKFFDYEETMIKTYFKLIWKHLRYYQSSSLRDFYETNLPIDNFVFLKWKKIYDQAMTFEANNDLTFSYDQRLLPMIYELTSFFNQFDQTKLTEKGYRFNLLIGFANRLVTHQTNLLKERNSFGLNLDNYIVPKDLNLMIGVLDYIDDKIHILEINKLNALAAKLPPLEEKNKQTLIKNYLQSGGASLATIDSLLTKFSAQKDLEFMLLSGLRVFAAFSETPEIEKSAMVIGQIKTIEFILKLILVEIVKKNPIKSQKIIPKMIKHAHSYQESDFMEINPDSGYKSIHSPLGTLREQIKYLIEHYHHLFIQVIAKSKTIESIRDFFFHKNGENCLNEWITETRNDYIHHEVIKTYHRALNIHNHSAKIMVYLLENFDFS